MNRNKLSWQIWVIVFGLMVILILGALAIRNAKQKDWAESPVTNESPVITEPSVSSVAIPTSTESASFRDLVPAGTTVPGTSTVLTPAQAKIIAVPTVVAPAAVQGSALFRNFNIKGEGNVFTPSQIIANFRDKVRINLTAVDKDYDFYFPSYSMMISVKKGETKYLEFEAMHEGSFNFYCNSCGGPDSSARGKIIIVK